MRLIFLAAILSLPAAGARAAEERLVGVLTHDEKGFLLHPLVSYDQKGGGYRDPQETGFKARDFPSFYVYRDGVQVGEFQVEGTRRESGLSAAYGRLLQRASKDSEGDGLLLAASYPIPERFLRAPSLPEAEKAQLRRLAEEEALSNGSPSLPDWPWRMSALRAFDLEAADHPLVQVNLVRARKARCPEARSGRACVEREEAGVWLEWDGEKAKRVSYAWRHLRADGTADRSRGREDFDLRDVLGVVGLNPDGDPEILCRQASGSGADYILVTKPGPELKRVYSVTGIGF